MAVTHKPEHLPGGISRRDAMKVILLGGAAAVGTGVAVEAKRKFKDFKALTDLGSPPVVRGAEGDKRSERTSPPDDMVKSESQLFAQSLDIKEADVSTKIVEKTDRFGSGFRAMLDSKTSTPLLMTNEKGEWTPAYFKELGKRSGMTAGFASDDSEANIVPLLVPEFNVRYFDWYWGGAKPVISRDFDFGGLNQLAVQTLSLGIDKFRLMLLNGHGQDAVERGWASVSTLPVWIDQKLKDGISSQELMRYMTEYIQATMNHLKKNRNFFPNPPEVAVVNEPYFGPQGLGDPFLPILGEEYVDHLYQVARETYPDATLMFIARNTYPNSEETAVDRPTVQRLKSKGIVDIVGFQMHENFSTMYLSPDGVTKTIQSYGMPSAVSESAFPFKDFPWPQNQMSQKEWFAEQARIVETLLGAAVKGGVKNITFWGLTDIVPKISSPDWGKYQNPWDKDGNRKPFYYAARRVFYNAAIDTSGSKLPAVE